MTRLTIKPQWYWRPQPDGGCSLTCESYHQVLTAEYTELLQRLNQPGGVDPESLDDSDFQRIEFLTERGYLNVDGHADAPAWELSGFNWHSVQEQIKHITFALVDNTKNGVGESLRAALLATGFEAKEDACVTIVVADSYYDLPDLPTNVLPVIVNRMRVNVGPMVFPWSTNIRETVRASPSYMPQPLYVLPPVFDALQRAWIAAAVTQFLATNKLRYVKHIVEYNMAQQEFKLWPV